MLTLSIKHLAALLSIPDSEWVFFVIFNRVSSSMHSHHFCSCFSFCIFLVTLLWWFDLLVSVFLTCKMSRWIEWQQKHSCVIICFHMGFYVSYGPMWRIIKQILLQSQQVIWAKLVRRATAWQFLFSGCLCLSLYFVAIHSWNLCRGQKLQRNTKSPYFPGSRSSMLTPLKSLSLPCQVVLSIVYSYNSLCLSATVLMLHEHEPIAVK